MSCSRCRMKGTSAQGNWLIKLEGICLKNISASLLFAIPGTGRYPCTILCFQGQNIPLTKPLKSWEILRTTSNGEVKWVWSPKRPFYLMRSEEHTSELQSRGHLV